MTGANGSRERFRNHGPNHTLRPGSTTEPAVAGDNVDPW